MKVISPSAEILTPLDREVILAHIERCGRTCYKSENRITPDSSARFVRMLVASGHHTVLEHCSATVRFVIDRGVSHELVRHRLASPSQESTRYCNYSKAKFGNELTFIKPFFFEVGTEQYRLWEMAMHHSEETYLSLIKSGATPQQARTVLPNSLKTEVAFTANLREWAWIFYKRCATDAHPQMREVMIPLRAQFQEVLPEIYEHVEFGAI